ncbi:hypothetical protein [Desulfurobacterium crinifex]
MSKYSTIVYVTRVPVHFNNLTMPFYATVVARPLTSIDPMPIFHATLVEKNRHLLLDTFYSI